MFTKMIRAIPEWLLWTLCVGETAFVWWQFPFPMNLDGLSLFLKNSVAIPADPIGLSWFLAGWSLIVLSVAVLLLGLLERPARRE
jgi:hypothetical protein